MMARHERGGIRREWTWLECGQCLARCTTIVGLLVALTYATGATSAEPAAPTGLAVMNPFGSVSLVWDVPPNGQNLTGYLLEAGSAPGLSDVAIAATNASDPSFTTSPAPPGTYYLRVRAVAGSAVSPPSNEVRLVVRPIADDPGAPTPPVVNPILVQGSTVTVSWAASANATSYVVEAGSWPGMNDLGELITSATSVTVSGVPPGVYYVNVYSRNARGTYRYTFPQGVILTSSCSYVTTPTLSDAGRFGAPNTVYVYTSSTSCSWTADTNRSWIHMNYLTGTAFGWSAPPNFGPIRVGLIKFHGGGRDINLFVQQSNFSAY